MTYAKLYNFFNVINIISLYNKHKESNIEITKITTNTVYIKLFYKGKLFKYRLHIMPNIASVDNSDNKNTLDSLDDLLYDNILTGIFHQYAKCVVHIQPRSLNNRYGGLHKNRMLTRSRIIREKRCKSK